MFVDETFLTFMKKMYVFKGGMIPGILFIRQSVWLICINANPVNLLHLKAQIVYRVREKKQLNRVILKPDTSGNPPYQLKLYMFIRCVNRYPFWLALP